MAAKISDNLALPSVSCRSTWVQQCKQLQLMIHSLSITGLELTAQVRQSETGLNKSWIKVDTGISEEKHTKCELNML